MTKVKDQKLCGACYAFTAISVLESHIFIKTGNLTDFSVQEVLDCSEDYHSSGCDGGLPFRVFDYVQDNGGISLDADYPFEGSSGNVSCKSSISSKFEVELEGYSTISSDDEDQMRRTIFGVGPIIGFIGVSHEKFMRYSSGIFIQNNCNPDEINHAVLLVGYGEENGIKYWIAKNSYGETWGESGFIKIATKREGHCGITTDLFYPIIA